MSIFYFNPRSPCGERPFKNDLTRSKNGFQSTLPMRGATIIKYPFFKLYFISIHAPHAGSDAPAWNPVILDTNFNPRSPCGERLRLNLQTYLARNFNPRSPCGERRGRSSGAGPYGNFNPRSPCGERRNYVFAVGQHRRFQSTLPMRGATKKS